MRVLFTIILSLALSACASSIKVSQPISRELISHGEHGGYSAIDIDSDSSNTPRKFMNAVARYLQQELQVRSLMNVSSGIYKITVQVTTFKMTTGNARELLGALSGADEVESTVRVINTKTDQVVGESIVTSHLMPLGGQDDVAWTHAGEIASFLVAK